MIAALFVSGRVLDLALAPGRDLGLVGPGVAHVNVEVVN
jgi:rare lipoprotein A (peptidoglycan hydrolase)